MGRAACILLERGKGPCAPGGQSFADFHSDGNIRYFEYENDKFEYLSEYKSADPQRGIAFIPRRGINVSRDPLTVRAKSHMSQVHENEIMRAFKTVNDSYIEPISFTVPRRAETFQSDIYPPAIGSKPAMSAKEWLDGKTAVPAKIDLESIYDGTAPVEVVSDFKPAPAPAPAPAKAPVVAKKEPEPAPVAYRAPPTAADQKVSISNMANKYQDNEESSDDDDAETSSFEEISRPVPRAAAPVSAPAPSKAPAPVKTPVTASPPVSRAAPAAASASPSGSSSEAGLLAQIKDLFDHQNKMIAAQGDKITAQSQIISQLAADVEGLKKRVGPGSQEQSERIRQLELELEEARS